MKKLFLCLFLFSFLEAEELKKKDTLVIGTSQEFESLHPHMMAMGASRYLQNMINRPLVTLDAGSKWTAMLAVEIPSGKHVSVIKENGILKTKALWKIRPEASWSDGKPVTCSDFQYSLEVGKNSNIQIANKDIFDNIDRIETTENKPKECYFIYSKKSWNFYQLPDFFPLPSHLDRNYYNSTKDTKAGYSNKNIYSAENAGKAAYSGPFRVVEIKPGSHIILEQNKFFHRRAYFSKVILKVIPSSNSFESHIKSGTLDVVAPIGITFDQALDFDTRWASDKDMNHKVVFKEGTSFEHLSFNLDYSLFKDIVVRQALIMSINRKEIVNSFFSGKQQVADFYHPRLCRWFPKDLKNVKTYSYDFKRAEQLLDQAGWKKEKDGFRYQNGEKLSFELSTTAGNTTRENIQVYLKNEWQKLGVAVQIKNYPARTLFGEIAKKRMFKGMIMHAWHVAPETTPFGYLSSSNIPNESNSWSGFNFGGWKSLDWDKLNKKLSDTADLASQKTIIEKMLNIYNTELPDIPLYYRVEVAIAPKNLKNFRLAGHTYPETNEIENWQY